MSALLLRASVDGAIAVMVVALICRMVPRLSGAARAALWWCVAARFGIALVWPSPILLPVLPARENVAVASHAAAATMTPAPRIDAAAPRRDTAMARGWMTWLSPVALALWGAGVLIGLLVIARQWRLTRHLIADSLPAPDTVYAMARAVAARVGVSPVPALRLSAAIPTPLVVGVRHPTILLPVDSFGRLSLREQEMALCHEMAHVGRHDLRWGTVPALVEAIFFFHPGAHVAAREYALGREAACDAAVLSALGGAPDEYARLLIELGIAPHRQRLAAAGASWSYTHLRRRLHMLTHVPASSTGSRTLALAVVGLSALLLTPIQLTARPTAPVPAMPQARVPAAAAPLAIDPPAMEPVAGMSIPVATIPVTSIPVTSIPVRSMPVTSMPLTSVPVRFGPAFQPDFLGAPERLGVAATAELTYVLFRDDRTRLVNGSSTDAERASRLRQGNERMMWIRRDGREYIIRDTATLNRVEALWAAAPQADLERRRADREREMARQIRVQADSERTIGDTVRAAVRRIEAERTLLDQVRQSAMSAERRRAAAATTADTGAAMAARMAALDAKRRELDTLGASMRELETRMAAVQRQIQDLRTTASANMAQQSDRLRREADLMLATQRAMEAASSKTRDIIEQAIASGVAKPVT